MLMYISLFRVPNPVNYTSELRELFAATTDLLYDFYSIIFKIKHTFFIYRHGGKFGGLGL